jgi:predicted RNA-binding protein YlqC (UPF0109 family)
MSSIDQQFIEYIVKSLVGKPDEVVIDRTIDEKGVLLELTVDPEDLGRVIGKRGATAQSLRTLLRALGTKNDARYNLKIVDNGVPRPEGLAPQTQTQAQSSDDSASDSDDAVSTEDTTPVDAPEVEEEADEPEESDRLKNTRKELADLDDLDI